MTSAPVTKRRSIQWDGAKLCGRMTEVENRVTIVLREIQEQLHNHTMLLKKIRYEQGRQREIESRPGDLQRGPRLSLQGDSGNEGLE